MTKFGKFFNSFASLSIIFFSVKPPVGLCGLFKINSRVFSFIKDNYVPGLRVGKSGL